MLDLELQHKIVRGEIDINNQSLFFLHLLKGLMFKLNNDITLRGEAIPHIILNTGDDTMYLEVKGQDTSIEPTQISNENFVYNKVPRCIVDMSDIEVLEDQLTNPYTRGNLEVESDDGIYSFSAEFRRMPIKMSVSLKYYLDTFTDVLDVTQKIMTHLLFVQNYSITYLGQTIFATYRIPSSFSHEKNITFDGGTTDSKLRTISFDIEVETNIPIYENRTAIKTDNVIRSEMSEVKIFNHNQIETGIPVDEIKKHISQ